MHHPAPRAHAIPSHAAPRPSGPRRTRFWRISPWRSALGLATLLTFAAPLPVQAEPSCAVPEAMALRGLTLPATRAIATSGKPLTILTLGGTQTAGTEAGDQSATWPARLEAALAAALPNATVSVVNEALPGSTAADISPRIAGLLTKTGARLVIWASGGRDAAQRSDPDSFRASLQTGIDAIRDGGADLILIDAPFVPAPERMARIEPYRQKLLRAAADNQIPLFRRHDLMRGWSENKTLNLAARGDTERQAVARHLFACVARGLAAPIVEALR